MGRWSERARETIAQVDAVLPPDAGFAERRKAIRDAYPFGERAYWPYKAWCKAVRAYLKPYGPATPEPPLLRDMMRETNPDIAFPFAEDPGNG